MARKTSGKGIMIVSLQIFYTFLILPGKVEKNEAENSRNAPLWKLSITMPYLYVCKMKTAASWKKTDPTLETRKIAL